MKSIVLCADDFGMSAEVSDGILDLVENTRLSAVSCMTSLPRWQSDAKRLTPFASSTAVGLHFNLTEFEHRIPLVRLMKQSMLSQLDLTWVREQFVYQCDQFEKAWGAPPDFIDGHQHVHVFRGIRDVVLDEIQKRYPQSTPWVRQVNPSIYGHDARLKAIILGVMSKGFSAAASERAIPLSKNFAGLYSLSPDADFPSLIEQWFQSVADGCVVMCHPGRAKANALGLALTRQKELSYLSGSEFDTLMSNLSILLATKPSLTPTTGQE